MQCGVGKVVESGLKKSEMQLGDQDINRDSGKSQQMGTGGGGKRQQCKNLVVERKRSKRLNS
jgi:glucuronokinase